MKGVPGVIAFESHSCLTSLRVSCPGAATPLGEREVGEAHSLHPDIASASLRASSFSLAFLNRLLRCSFIFARGATPSGSRLVEISHKRNNHVTDGYE
jgi:hypothetical protein